MLFTREISMLSVTHQSIADAYRMDEDACINTLIDTFSDLTPSAMQRIEDFAYYLINEIRTHSLKKGSLDALLHEYDLSSAEGIALMCLAEAFLRIPDTSTIDRLINDKITAADWQARLNNDDSLWVNTASWALMLTGKVLSLDEDRTQSSQINHIFKTLVQRSGEPIIRKCVQQMMHVLSQQFVMGASITAALKRAKPYEARGFTYSYDMLGEAAMSQQDADKYFHAYLNAIKAIGQSHQQKDVFQAPGISVKLSALHPRYEIAQHQRVIAELPPKLLELAKQAKLYNIGLTIDAEEASRLELSLDVFANVFSDPEFSNWEGLGLAVQAYQKRAYYVIDWLATLAERYKRRIMLRLVKGAYWDSEIKYTQELGLADYPVFTHKANTDISYLACARRILATKHAFYPQFATHNAYSIAAILEFAGDDKTLEFQCLHGMGHNLYEHLVGKEHINVNCRIYAPVGSYQELLPYLVRRLLENGANTSFVNLIANKKQPIATLTRSPITKVSALKSKRHPQIPLPRDLYGQQRKNSLGLDLTCHRTVIDLDKRLEQIITATKLWHAEPILEGQTVALVSERREILRPDLRNVCVGTVINTHDTAVAPAIAVANQAYLTWHATTVDHRASCLEKAADLLELHFVEFMVLAIREAGKTVADAIAEVREAIDFLRYYAMSAREKFTHPHILPGVTGEYNQLQLVGRGTIVCISPWNFPLAIFLGQISAALVAGNSVLAKPAEQTPLIAYHAVKLLLNAGIPRGVIQLIVGSGRTIGQQLIASEHIAGVMFTGSTQTAKHINQTLANRHHGIIPFIAETGGQNVMLVDSSALPEQVVRDVVNSAFGSAGQRCSALRVLYLQEDVADKILTLLKGAMAELTVGDPGLLNTDVGPVIDETAKQKLQHHFNKMQQHAKLIYQVTLDNDSMCDGNFFAPCAFLINSITELTEEIFGPCLHVIRYHNKDLPKIIDDINQSGYGLTLGIHSRINKTVDFICQRVRVGNIYVNRNMIGAVVGVQPFGGEGLSGTGPKAGGPNYLTRLVTERTLTINTAAAGGNASLMTLSD